MHFELLKHPDGGTYLKRKGTDQMKFEVTVLDENTGIVQTLTIAANSHDEVMYKVESDPHHEYEIIEIEKA